MSGLINECMHELVDEYIIGYVHEYMGKKSIWTIHLNIWSQSEYICHYINLTIYILNLKHVLVGFQSKITQSP